MSVTIDGFKRFSGDLYVDIIGILSWTSSMTFFRNIIKFVEVLFSSFTISQTSFSTFLTIYEMTCYLCNLHKVFSKFVHCYRLLTVYLFCSLRNPIAPDWDTSHGSFLPSIHSLIRPLKDIFRYKILVNATIASPGAMCLSSIVSASYIFINTS